jgi:hypothetical protein
MRSIPERIRMERPYTMHGRGPVDVLHSKLIHCGAVMA